MRTPWIKLSALWLIIALFAPGGDLEGQPAEGPESRRTSGVRQMIAEIGPETLTESIVRLTEEIGYDVYRASNQKNPEDDLETLLGNRRVLKVLDAMAQLPSGNLHFRCEELLRGPFDTSQSTFEAILRSYEVRGAPQNNVSMMGNKLGVSAALYVASMYCDGRQVLSWADRVLAEEMAVVERVERQDGVFPEILPRAMRSMGFVQNRVLLNVYMNLLPSDMERRKRNLPSREVVLRQWDDAEQPLLPWYAMTDARADEAGAARLSLYGWPRRERHDPVRQLERLASVREWSE